MLTRGRAEYEPLGVRAGSFLVFPALEILETFNTNVYSTEDNERADLITSFQPRIDVDSDWANHSLSFFGGADVGVYMDEGREDYEDYNFGSRGGIDIQRQTNVDANVEFKHTHGARSDSDDAGGINPTLNDQYIANLGGSHTINRVTITLDGDFNRYDYLDSPTAAGGVSTGQVNNDDRDRNEWKGTTRVSYEIQPEYAAFFQGSYNVRAYLSSRDDIGYDRDSTGYRVEAGTELNFTDVTTGDVFFGYLEQTPKETRLETTSGFVFGTHLTWNATRLTTVRLNIDRNVLETTTAGVSGIDSTTASATVDHELRRNILLDAGVSLTNDAYNGGNPRRNDNLIVLGAGARYLLNRNFFVGAGYDFTHRASQGSVNGDYTKHELFFRVGAQL